MKRLRIHELAEADIDSTFAYYWTQGGDQLSERFLNDYDQAVTHIARHPGTGSARYASATGDAPLRFWMLKHFPYSVFYVERPAHIDVLRLLHQSSDVPRQLG
ncbi:MAG: type II toxin-antitoxin system RelE/ParE family toxin [Pseudomonadota bacterium]|nr:type II toxin-antitoxin system RelE/ParE family toxin [Pseudomonadota bacterium]